MKKLTLYLVACMLLLAGADVQAQRKVISPDRGKKTVKDSLVLGCILQGQVYDPLGDDVDVMGGKEPKVVVSSNTDTTVMAPWDLVISSVKRLEDGTFELIASHQDYWFWFTGIEKVKAYKGQVVKKGESLGFLETGRKVELLLYDFETPIDPRRFIICR